MKGHYDIPNSLNSSSDTDNKHHLKFEVLYTIEPGFSGDNKTFFKVVGMLKEKYADVLADPLTKIHINEEKKGHEVSDKDTSKKKGHEVSDKDTSKQYHKYSTC